MVKILFFLIVAIIATTISDAHPRGLSKVSSNQIVGIVGGHDTTIEEHPWHLSLLLLNNYRCGAVLIGKKWALTAAQCTYGKLYDFMEIRAGTDQFNEGQKFRVANIYENPKYDDLSYDYDLTIIELEEEIDLNNTAPIEIADDFDPVEGTNVTITGFGRTSEGGLHPETLQEIDTVIVDHTLCNSIMNFINPVTRRMLCAGEIEYGGKDSCQGDSGSPLVIDGKLVGLVSWGFGCARPGFPGVYVAVASMRDYITEITGL